MDSQKYSFFYLIYAYFLNIWIQVLSLFKNKSIIKSEPTLVEQNNSFVDKNKNFFIKSIENLDNTKNQNIDTFFYNKKEYRVIMEEPNNQCEKIWKSRILMQSTPQGTNIIMYYDPYKLGFTYYCDQTMSYNILNSIAMKYVLYYKCYDLFLDEFITKEPSPLLKLLEDDKPEKSIEKEKEKTSSKEDRELKDMLKRAPVAKFKNYNKASGKVESFKNGNNGNNDNDKKNGDKPKEENEKREPEKPKERNRFIYLGKITNFSFLQKIKKPAAIHFKDSSLIKSGLFANSDVQKEVFNYRDFKRLKENTK
jgi:hypothetical protein